MIDSTFLRTRVARRVFAMFLLSALVPTGVLAVIAYHQVSGQLMEQSAERLRLTSKLQGQAVQERLGFATGDLRSGASAIAEVPIPLRDSALQSLAAGNPRLSRLSVAEYAEQATDPVPSPRREHLQSGKPVLATNAAGEGSQVLLGIAIEPADLGAGILWAELRPDYLWASEDNRVGVTGTSVCVASEGLRLYCEVPIPSGSLESLHTVVTSSRSARFSWRDEETGEEQVAAHWEMFLRHEYLESNWSVIASMSRNDVVAPASRFRLTFVLSLLLSLAIVFVLSNVQIRRSLEPLRQLTRGTRHISGGDFDVRVPVVTKDEFGDLATSFNTMAHRLSKQFNALGARNQIDRAILSSLDTSGIVHSVLAGAAGIAGADTVAVNLMLDEPGSARSFVRTGSGQDMSRTVEREISITSEATQELRRHPEELWIDGRHGELSCLASIDTDMEAHLILPVRVNGVLGGWMSLGYADRTDCTAEDRKQARQLADQVAVGFTNARLVESLDELGWATIRALARTIDAKSRWTAGHSERVTRLALALGGELGVGAEELDLIKRGGLLHDIGKIGVPGAILDKPTRLSEEEFEVVRQHPVIGARILEPIEGLASVIGIVKHHHERIDGTGYPDGLSGEEIPYLARLLSVADVWDSLRSDRPYRAELSRELTAQIIREGSGTQFEPGMVELFLTRVAVVDVDIVGAVGGSSSAEVITLWEDERHAV